MKYIKVKSGVFRPFFLAYYSNEVTMQMVSTHLSTVTDLANCLGRQKKLRPSMRHGSQVTVPLVT